MNSIEGFRQAGWASELGFYRNNYTRYRHTTWSSIIQVHHLEFYQCAEGCTQVQLYPMSKCMLFGQGLRMPTQHLIISREALLVATSAGGPTGSN